eukprot:5813521-Amphidinium_carterae.1
MQKTRRILELGTVGLNSCKFGELGPGKFRGRPVFSCLLQQWQELDEVAYSNVVKVTTDDEGPPVSSALSHRSTPSSRDDTTPTSTQKDPS